MKNLIRIIGIILIIISIQSCKKEVDNQIRDADGNVYTTVTIGTQVWLVENLKTTRYRNGDLIGTTTPATLDITADTMPKYQWAYDGMECSAATYGRLYTWFAATDIRGICPIGWHLPAIIEWVTLCYPYDIGIGNIIGADLMESGTTHWQRNDIVGTNETGFTALPGGFRGASFADINNSCEFWSSNESAYASKGNALFYPIPITSSFGSTPMSLIHSKKTGHSLRCLKDSI